MSAIFDGPSSWAIANRNDLSMSEAALKAGSPNSNPLIYANARSELARFTVTLPPAAAVAGVYATVDRTRGVWKSPANAGVLVFPMTIAPAARRTATGAASSAGTLSVSDRDPAVVRMPAVA